MIIFDLDGTLAHCEHRRHFVDCVNYDQSNKGYISQKTCNCPTFHSTDPWIHKDTREKWKPDWKAFYESCDKDEPIYPTIGVFKMLEHCNAPLHIWSGRCESTQAKTNTWLIMNVTNNLKILQILKMRPIGDNTPDHILKERWLDEALAEGEKIDFVFDSDPRSIEMWRRRGKFVFDCNQSGVGF